MILENTDYGPIGTSTTYIVNCIILMYMHHLHFHVAYIEQLTRYGVGCA